MLGILGLVASYAPEIVGMFTGGGSKVDKAIEIASNLAESVTGKKGDEAMAAIEGSPELQLEFKKALMADSHIAEEMRLNDRADARDMFKHNNDMQKDMAKQIMKMNLPFIFALLTINAAIMVFVTAEYAAAAQALGTMIGMVIQSLLKERQDLVGFSFGSSAGSKQKDSLVAKRTLA